MMLAKIVLLVGVVAYCHGMQSLVDVIGANNGTTLVSLIKQASLEDTLAGPGPFTVLVPVDSAFAVIPEAEVASLTADKDALANVLKFHIIKGEQFSFNMVNGQILRTLSWRLIRCSEKGGNIYLNDAKVLAVDIEASNGVVYLIDRVLDVPEGSIMDILDNKSHNLTQFASLVRLARIQNRLSSHVSGNKYTVFAPSNAAFDKLPASVLSAIFAKTSLQERDIVDYHIHAGNLHIKNLDHAGGISTYLSGHEIRVTTADNQVTFNGKALLEESDIPAENGVLHVIDQVLIPSNLGSIIG